MHCLRGVCDVSHFCRHSGDCTRELIFNAGVCKKEVSITALYPSVFLLYFLFHRWRHKSCSLSFLPVLSLLSCLSHVVKLSLFSWTPLSEYVVSNVLRDVSEDIHCSVPDSQHGLSDGNPPPGFVRLKILLHMISRVNDVLVLLAECAGGWGLVHSNNPSICPLLCGAPCSLVLCRTFVSFFRKDYFYLLVFNIPTFSVDWAERRTY